MKKLNKRRKLAVAFLLILVFNSAGIVNAGKSEIISMNFIDTDIRKVLNSIAEMADVNLVIDDSVEGKVSINLKDISFEKSLKMVVQTKRLDYKWDKNTVVVATPERIAKIYEKNIIKTMILEEVDLIKLKNILKGVFTELTVQLNEISKQIILTGKEETVNQAQNLIDDLNLPPEEGNFLDNIKIKNADIEELEDIIDSLFPGLEIFAHKDQQLFLLGEKKKIEIVRNLIKQKNEISKEKITEIIDMNITNLETVNKSIETIETIYPDLKIIDIPGTEKSRFVIWGIKEDVRKTVNLLKKIYIDKNKLHNNDKDDKQTEPEIISRIIKIENSAPENIKGIVENIYQKLIIAKNTITNQLILHGMKDDIESAEKLINQLDVLPDKQDKDKKIKEKSRKIIKLNHIEPLIIKEKIKDFFPELEIKIEHNFNHIILSGEKNMVKQIQLMVERFDQEQKKITKITGIDYIDLNEINNILTAIIPEINLQIV